MNYIRYSTAAGLLVVSFTKVYPRFNKITDRDKVSLQEVIRLIQLFFGHNQFCVFTVSVVICFKLKEYIFKT